MLPNHKLRFFGKTHKTSGTKILLLMRKFSPIFILTKKIKNKKKNDTNPILKIAGEGGKGDGSP
jgi:hypothetical protein